MGRKRGRTRKERPQTNKKPSHVSYADAPKENLMFEKYYKVQKICPQDEWDAFMAALTTDLPTAFRVTSSKSEAKSLLQVIQGKYFKELLNDKPVDGEVPKEPMVLPWYPDNLAWQLQLSRRDIRRSEAFFKLHHFLISETASGNISRQEVVSMIPPIVLDIKSHHKVLDMCAAPGSKTAQLIESLHHGEERLPSGFVVANDVDNQRCYMLVHQAKRLNSPNVIITNHDATIMPNLYISQTDNSESIVKFDRILCDVPCTGDGTLRKNIDIWPKWNTANGASLHGIQYRIVKRGCEMLEIGGRIVYSTCSLNPMENEAVIARLLLDAKGSLQLVDASSLLPGLKYNSGITHWTPMSRDMIEFSSPLDVPEKWKTSIPAHVFPPSAEDAAKLNLNRCIRVLPHQQDTGAFFVAAIEKVKHLPWEAAPKKIPEDGTLLNSDETKSKEPARKKRRIYGYKEDPFIFFEDNEPIYSQLKEHYSLSENFPKCCLLTRCKEGKKKNIYMTSQQVRDIVIKNAERVKIINTGVKVFARCENKEMKCDYRLVNEGLWSIFPFIGKERHVKVTKEDLLTLLTVEDITKPPLTTSLSSAIQENINVVGKGSCVLVYDDPKTSLHLELVGWVGAISSRAYVAPADCAHYVRLLGGDTSKFEKNKFCKVADGVLGVENGGKTPECALIEQDKANEKSKPE